MNWQDYSGLQPRLEAHSIEIETRLLALIPQPEQRT